MPSDQLVLFPLPARALTFDEVTAILECAIRAGGAGALSRHADVFLATICAEVLASRLELAGVVFVQNRPDPAASDGLLQR